MRPRSPIELHSFTAAALPLRSLAAGAAEAEVASAPVLGGETVQRQGRHLRRDISMATEARRHRREDPRAAAAYVITGSPQNLRGACRRYPSRNRTASIWDTCMDEDTKLPASTGQDAEQNGKDMASGGATRPAWEPGGEFATHNADMTALWLRLQRIST